MQNEASLVFPTPERMMLAPGLPMCAQCRNIRQRKVHLCTPHSFIISVLIELESCSVAGAEESTNKTENEKKSPSFATPDFVRSYIQHANNRCHDCIDTHEVLTSTIRNLKEGMPTNKPVPSQNEDNISTTTFGTSTSFLKETLIMKYK